LAWSPNGGGTLTTVLPGGTCSTSGGKVNQLTGRVYFGLDYGCSPQRLYTWIPGGSLSTLINNGNGIPWNTAFDSNTGRYYFGISNWGDPIYSHHTSTGLSTLAGDPSSGIHFPGNSNHGMVVDSVSGRLYFKTADTNCDDSCQPSANKSIYTWANGVLSTILFNKRDPGYKSITLNPATGGIYFGERLNTNGSFYHWSTSTGLSTVATGLRQPGYASTAVADNGRVYFGENGSAHSFLTWTSTGGVFTILSGRSYPGLYSTAVDTSTGRVYFGEGSATGNFYTWYPSTGGGSTVPLVRVSNLGEPSNQPQSMEFNSGTYTAMTQDGSRNFYLLETSGKTVDRYTYSSSASAYTRSSRLAWTTWATTVGAIAIDASTNGIALLDTGNKQIDIYADRTVNGTPAAPTSLSISGTTTPTGLAVSNRTGDYLVLDSALQSSSFVRLFVYSNTGTLKRTLTIDVTTANLSVSATGETDFKILYNDQDNILYLLSPSLGRIFALSLPEYL
jgi:hypothetical protein